MLRAPAKPPPCALFVLSLAAIQKVAASGGGCGRRQLHHPTAAAAVVDQLAEAMEPALVATAGPRYFGFVTGGALDAATAAEVLTTGWDRIAFNWAWAPAPWSRWPPTVREPSTWPIWGGCSARGALGRPSSASWRAT